MRRIAVNFDVEHAVASAGLILPATVSGKLGLEQAADELVGVGYRPGRKVATVVHAMLAGGDCIDDVDVLRAGATGRVVGHEVAAPSTVGTWLRQFTFGHVRQLDRLAETMLARAWAAGAGPGYGPLVVDVDSTVCEVHGYAKQGAAFGYTRQRGLHPMVATRSDTGEVLHARQRKGSANTARGAQRSEHHGGSRLRAIHPPMRVTASCTVLHSLRARGWPRGRPAVGCSLCIHGVFPTARRVLLLQTDRPHTGDDQSKNRFARDATVAIPCQVEAAGLRARLGVSAGG